MSSHPYYSNTSGPAGQAQPPAATTVQAAGGVGADFAAQQQQQQHQQQQAAFGAHPMQQAHQYLYRDQQPIPSSMMNAQQPHHHHQQQQQQQQQQQDFSTYSSSSTAQNPASNRGPVGDASGAHRGANPAGYKCPNCNKIFARDDLLRRHLAREARAAAQPSLDRQKSCYECARSKARCDLEVPSCGRCKARGKTCVYGARSGNPNVRRQPQGTPSWQSGGSGDAVSGPSQWNPGTLPVGSGFEQFPKPEYGSSADEYDSNDGRGSFSDFRNRRTLSTSSSSAGSASFDLGDQMHSQQQQGQQQGFGGSQFETGPGLGPRSESPASMSTGNAQRGFARTGTRGSIDTSVDRRGSEFDNEEGEETPVNRHGEGPPAASASDEGDGSRTGAMGPPLMTPSRFRPLGQASTSAASGYSGTQDWTNAQAHRAALVGNQGMETLVGTSQYDASQTRRPQMPKLLTGERMPRPQGMFMPGTGGGMSGRPLFSAQVDLSGWLEEPVIPSPLYRMGPSLSALGANAQAYIPTTPIANQSGAGTTEQQQQQRQEGDSIMSEGQTSNPQVAARHWWTHSSAQHDIEITQGVAQACAGHFTLYPSLMVLPDPTSPVPPLFHRPWLARTRLETHVALARARVIMAGHHVRLPASEGMVWELVANESKSIVASIDSLAHGSDADVFASTSALWFFVILLLMSSDPSSTTHIPNDLIDSSLIGLSRISRLLSQRIRALEERRKTQGAAFLEWGFEETMRRTLFASYALLVLQRFRETSVDVQTQLAGLDLILDVGLPAVASEFEAGNDLEWRAAQAAKIESHSHPTMRDLLIYRSAATAASESVKAEDQSKEKEGTEKQKQEVPAHLINYFDRHDGFTNVCLSVAFALDSGVSSFQQQ